MLYRAFTTVGRRSHDTTVSGVEAVKVDLLNHLNTRFREVPGRPYFGCGLQSLLGRPFDDNTEAGACAEFRRVVESDPRVIVREVYTAAQDGAILIRALLHYVEFNREEWMGWAVKD